MDVRDGDDALDINVRMEGEKTFTPTAADGTTAPPVVVNAALSVRCGLTAWKDNPYRGTAICSYPFEFGRPRPLDLDDEVDERTFSSLEELSLWLEATIKSYTALGFTMAAYKANGMPLDWLQGVNLPPE